MRQKQFIKKIWGALFAVFVLLLFPFHTIAFAAPATAANTGGDLPVAFIVLIGALVLFIVFRYRQAIKYQGKFSWQEYLGFHHRKKDEK